MLVCVMQLTCVGGTAGCSAFIPQVVQCYNRGSDGIEVQVGSAVMFHKCNQCMDV